MIRRILTTFVLTVCTLVPMTSNAASLFGRTNNAAASTDMPKGDMPKGKTVKLMLKNRTDAAMTIVVNDKPVTIAANGEYALKTAEGTDVYEADRTTVKLHVTGDMNGNTVSFR